MPPEFVIITGLSGAGKTSALHFLEDLGFFCVDNLPSVLLPDFARLLPRERETPGVAVVVDVRGGELFDRAVEAFQKLEDMGVSYRIVYLDALDEVLIRRFKETRRRHPLAPEGRVAEGLAEERRRLEPWRDRAHIVLDTTHLRPADLRRRLADLFSRPLEPLFLYLVSFGYKFGLPLDADLVVDVRFLPNPHYVPELRPLPGTDRRVVRYVLQMEAARDFLRRMKSFLRFLLPHYLAEGKSQFTIALGCTGGRHRSVVLAEALGRFLRRLGYRVTVEHRDLERACEE